MKLSFENKVNKKLENFYIVFIIKQRLCKKTIKINFIFYLYVCVKEKAVSFKDFYSGFSLVVEIHHHYYYFMLHLRVIGNHLEEITHIIFFLLFLSQN